MFFFSTLYFLDFVTGVWRAIYIFMRMLHLLCNRVVSFKPIILQKKLKTDKDVNLTDFI